MSVLFEQLKLIVDSFNRNKVEFALCGGLAVSAYGPIRATEDIDFLIREEALEPALQAAAEVGYDIRGFDISFKDRSVEIQRVSRIVDREVISLDLLLVTPEVEDVWANRRRIDFLGMSLYVVSRDGLIKMKKQAGRPQDLIDIDKLEDAKD
jgi:hypothetical protein